MHCYQNLSWSPGNTVIIYYFVNNNLQLNDQSSIKDNKKVKMKQNRISDEKLKKN